MGDLEINGEKCNTVKGRPVFKIGDRVRVKKDVADKYDYPNWLRDGEIVNKKDFVLPRGNEKILSQHLYVKHSNEEVEGWMSSEIKLIEEG